MSFICKYCNTSLSRKDNLIRHQELNKKCLLKQGNPASVNLFKCKECDKIYKSNRALISHQPCKVLCNKLLNKVLEQKAIISEQKVIISEQKAVISELRMRLDDANLKLEKFENNTIEQSNRPTYTNINKNKYDITILNLDADRIGNIVMDNYNLAYLRRGVKGVAQFLDKYVLRDKDNRLMYICTDKSRKKFKYKTLDGVAEDIWCSKLLTVTHPPIISKSQILLDEQEDDVDVYEDIIQDIRNIKKDNRFYNEIIRLS